MNISFNYQFTNINLKYLNNPILLNMDVSTSQNFTGLEDDGNAHHRRWVRYSTAVGIRWRVARRCWCGCKPRIPTKVGVHKRDGVYELCMRELIELSDILVGLQNTTDSTTSPEVDTHDDWMSDEKIASLGPPPQWIWSEGETDELLDGDMPEYLGWTESELDGRVLTYTTDSETLLAKCEDRAKEFDDVFYTEWSDEIDSTFYETALSRENFYSDWAAEIDTKVACLYWDAIDQLLATNC